VARPVLGRSAQLPHDGVAPGAELAQDVRVATGGREDIERVRPIIKGGEAEVVSQRDIEVRLLNANASEGRHQSLEELPHHAVADEEVRRGDDGCVTGAAAIPRPVRSIAAGCHNGIALGGHESGLHIVSRAGGVQGAAELVTHQRSASTARRRAAAEERAEVPPAAPRGGGRSGRK
jgi:hypothetical protein